MVMMMITSLINMAHLVHYVVAIIIPPKHCFKGEHDINDIMEKMNISGINHNKVVYIHKGEHDNPHGLPQQQDLEGSRNRAHSIFTYC